MTTDARWQDEFLRLFASGGTDEVRAAFELKHKNLPPRLYKFFSPSPHAFRGLVDDTIWRVLLSDAL